MSTIFTDGHPVGLNGQGGMFANEGYTLIEMTKSDMKRQRIRMSYVKPSLTNNEAEIVAIIHACSLAEYNSIIKSDSQIAIGYCKYGGRLERLAFLSEIAKPIIKEKNLTLQWIPREENPIT